jgi:hypothetical protein
MPPLTAQALEAEAVQQRLVQDRAATARHATWDQPKGWLTRPSEQQEQDEALAACKRDWEAQLAEQARLGGRVKTRGRLGMRW